MDYQDGLAVLLGAGGWLAAVPIVKFCGEFLKNGETLPKLFTMAVALGISTMTTPVLGYVGNFQTRDSRIRGVALALGTAQTIDGVVHLFFPNFYSADPTAARFSSASIFFGAGTLGLLSVYT